jgi:hypothetical protein
MPMSDTDATLATDALLDKIFQSQTELLRLPNQNPNDTTGRQMGEFIAALRLELKKMYVHQ